MTTLEKLETIKRVFEFDKNAAVYLFKHIPNVLFEIYTEQEGDEGMTWEEIDKDDLEVYIFEYKIKATILEKIEGWDTYPQIYISDGLYAN